MIIKSLTVQNFMSFGAEASVIDFEKIGNGLVRISGDIINTKKDQAAVDAESDLPDDNGAGKSSLIAAIYYGLFGDALRRKRKKMTSSLVHNGEGPMMVEIEVDDLLIRRGRQPNVFDIYEDPEGNFPESKKVDIAKDMQEWLEAKLGIDQLLFRSTAIFDQRNCDAFLESEAKDRRSIVEGLLGMDEWGGYLERTRAMLRDEKNRHGQLSSLVDRERSLGASVRQKVHDLREQAKKRSEQLLADSKSMEDGIANLENVQPDAILAGHDLFDEYMKKKQAYEAATEAVNVQRSLCEGMTSQISNGKNEYESLAKDLSAAKEEVSRISDEQPPQEALCSKCNEPVESLYERWKVDRDRRLKSASGSVDRVNSKIESLRKDLSGVMERHKLAKQELASRNKRVEETEKTPPVAPSRPGMSREQAVKMADQLKLARARVESLRKQAGENPYADTIEQYKAEAKKHDANIVESEKELEKIADHVNLLKQWEEAFGDKGIKAYCVRSITGELNNQTNFWLQHLSGGRITVKFDETLEVSVFVDDMERDLGLVSNGEATRVDIAVYFAFADIMRMTNKSDCNIVFLDEVGGNALDPAGKAGLHRALCELAEDRTVAVITHDKPLAELMDGGMEIVVTNTDGDAVARLLESHIYTADAGG